MGRAAAKPIIFRRNDVIDEKTQAGRSARLAVKKKLPPQMKFRR
jgi:hypothetical protein